MGGGTYREIDMERIKVQQVSKRIQVTCPYDERFVVGAHTLGGRWRQRTGIWSFPFHQEGQVRTLLQQVFNWTESEAVLRRGLKHADCGGLLVKLQTMPGNYQCQLCKELVRIGTHVSRDRQGYIQKQMQRG